MIYYTAITNAYFQLPPNKSGEHFVCYHDGTVEEQDGWELREIKYSHDDPVRLSRHPKILCPIEGKSVYIDASKLHTINDKFFELSEDILNNNNFFLMQHPHKYYYLEECAEYIHRGFMDPYEIINFTSEIKHETDFDFANFFSPLGTVLWRNSEAWMPNMLWWKWYMRGGRRDQVSLSVALQTSEVKYDWEECRSCVGKWSDANPVDGTWWKNKGGRYGKTRIDPTDTVEKLANITGLNIQMRYRAAIMKENGDWLFGDRSEFWEKNDPKLVIVNGF